jgi:uncharacterized repeat protein (TIGR01451 family)
MEPQKNTSPNPTPSQSPQFVKKAVETPFLESNLKNQLQASSSSSVGGFKGFYKDNRIYIWGIAGGLIIISLLAFLAFRSPPKPVVKEAKVNVTIDAPQRVASGGEVIYKIKVENQDSSKLVGLELEVTYPDGVSYISSSPKASNISGSAFPMPDLINGQNAVVIIKAKATGNINDEKKLNAKLLYHYSNFSSRFTKEASYSIRLSASDVAMEISGPSTTNNAQIVLYTLKYQNNSKDEIKNARVNIIYPEGFSYISATPQPDLDNNTWNISVLPAGGSGTIELQGNFRSSGSGESKTIEAKILVGREGQYYEQGSTSFSTAISSLPLMVSQQLENSNGDVVKPGDLLTYSINYQNNAKTVASGVNIIVTLNSKALDLSSLRTEGGQVNGSTILWNASTVANLESLSPNESGTLSFSVMIKNPATKDSSKNLTVVSGIKIKSGEYDAFFPGNDLTLKISSPAKVTGSLKYFSGTLPPQVGKETLYTVSLSLSNSTNDFSDGVLTAFVPLGSKGFVDKSENPAESGRVEFDSTTGKVTWNFAGLPAHTGQFSSSRTLQFQVRIVPSASQVNQSPTLVKDIQVEAKDIFTGQNVSINTDDITTGDLSGDQGWGSGQVVQ